jgi:hypothetical protein
MFSWRGEDGRALETARVLLGRTGLRALGRSVHAPADGSAFTVSYRLVVDDLGVVSRLSVTTASLDRERNLTLNRTEDGYWLMDTGAGGSRAQFDGAVDIDLQSSVLFNALPTRRLDLHRRSGEQELPMVYVSVPNLEVALTTQRYSTVSTLTDSDDEDRAVIGFSSGDFASELTVDANGIPLAYPGTAVRI